MSSSPPACNYQQWRCVLRGGCSQGAAGPCCAGDHASRSQAYMQGTDKSTVHIDAPRRAQGVLKAIDFADVCSSICALRKGAHPAAVCPSAPVPPAREQGPGGRVCRSAGLQHLDHAGPGRLPPWLPLLGCPVDMAESEVAESLWTYQGAHESSDRRPPMGWCAAKVWRQFERYREGMQCSASLCQGHTSTLYFKKASWKDQQWNRSSMTTLRKQLLCPAGFRRPSEEEDVTIASSVRTPLAAGLTRCSDSC